jgi:hypothetical protein
MPLQDPALITGAIARLFDEERLLVENLPGCQDDCRKARSV